MNPTHLYSYQLEGLELYTYNWIINRAQAEYHPDLPYIRANIRFDVCPYCNQPTHLSFYQDVVNKEMRNHKIAHHPIRYGQSLFTKTGNQE